MATSRKSRECLLHCSVLPVSVALGALSVMLWTINAVKCKGDMWWEGVTSSVFVLFLSIHLTTPVRSDSFCYCWSGSLISVLKALRRSQRDGRLEWALGRPAPLQRECEPVDLAESVLQGMEKRRQSATGRAVKVSSGKWTAVCNLVCARRRASAQLQWRREGCCSGLQVGSRAARKRKRTRRRRVVGDRVPHTDVPMCASLASPSNATRSWLNLQCWLQGRHSYVEE